MSIDARTRMMRDIRVIAPEEIFEVVLPDAVERNGELAARGLAYKALPALALEIDGRSVTLREQDGKLLLEAGDVHAGAIAAIEAGAASNLVQDRQTTIGLAMTAKVKMTRGNLDAWIGWEPVFRALLDGRRVYESGDIVLRDRHGAPLDLTKGFDLDDDRDEISHFIEEAGFLHIRNVYTEAEMAAVSKDLDAALALARPDDGESWWAGDSKGVEQAVRVLWFHEKSAALDELLYDGRLQWLADLTGDGHDGSKMGAEGLIKPLDIRTGLSDLPWHKDCGQGGHSYSCCGMTVGISVTGAGVDSGALGVAPGSHRANVQTAGLDPSLDIPPLELETRTGDVTVHCSDTLHRAHHPTKRPRKVVYTGFRLPLLPGDVAPELSKSEERAARARLTDVRDRIDAADNHA